MMRIRVLWTGVGGSPYYSNFYFPDGLSTAAQQHATDIRNILAGFTTSLRAGLVAAVQPEVLVIDPATGDATGAFIINPGASVTFTSTAEALPPFTQLLVRLRTDAFVGGRRVQGRFFMPGWTEASNQQGGTPLSALVSGIADNFAAVITGTDRMGVWSRKGGTFTQVTGLSAGTQWAVLRSRRD